MSVASEYILYLECDDQKGKFMDFESKWVALAITGDLKALTAIVKEYSPRIYNLAFRYMRNKEDAEDVLQESFMKMIHKINTYKGNSSLYSWLYRITTNTALEKLRKKHPEQFLLDMDTVDYGSHGSSSLVELPHYDKKDIMAVDFQAELNSLLNELNAKLRIVFILRDIEGNSVSETAQILNLSESNVKVRLMRARMFLKERLSANYLERV